MSGYTKSYRQKWSHPIFRDLLEAGIWAWMCDTAVWKDTTTRFNGELVKLKRGQLVTSVRFISQGFRIGEQVTRTFMQNLENEGMTNTLPTHRGTIITICNYDKYQQNENADNTLDNTQLTNSQHTANTNKKEYKKERSKERTPLTPTGEFELFWDLFPRQRRGDKTKAHLSWVKALSKANASEIIAGAKSYAASDEVARGYAKGCAAWLNDSRWVNLYNQKSSSDDHIYAGVRT